MQQKRYHESSTSTLLFDKITAQLVVNRDPDREPLIQNIPLPPTFFRLVTLFLLVIGVMGSGGLNRVAGKVVTVPMNEYSFFLAMFNAIVYVILYFIILLIRYWLKIVPGKQFADVWRKSRDDSLNCISRIGPWKYFLLIGLTDGISTILQLIASPYLPGPIISLLSQSSILFSMIISTLILLKKFTFWEIWSVILVYFGVTVTLIPEFSGIDESISVYYSLIMGFVALPSAIAVTLKELLFRNYDFDLFIVNSHGSLFQLISFPFFLPLAILFDQTQGQPLLTYIINGFYCFIGKTPVGSKFDCSPDPYPYVVYIGINLIYNLLLLMLVKYASAVLCFMTLQAVLPVSVILFYINWPYLEATKFSIWTIMGLVVIMVALALYQFFSLQKKQIPKPCLSCSLPFLENALYKNTPKNLSETLREEKNFASID